MSAWKTRDAVMQDTLWCDPRHRTKGLYECDNAAKCYGECPNSAGVKVVKEIFEDQCSSHNALFSKSEPMSARIRFARFLNVVITTGGNDYHDHKLG